MRRLACLLGLFLAALLVEAASDTVTLTPVLQGRPQACFLDRINGYVTSYDGSHFRVVVIATGCGADNKLPVECSPFLRAKRGLPAELVPAAASPMVLPLQVDIPEGNVASVEFNGKVTHPCRRRHQHPFSIRMI